MWVSSSNLVKERRNTMKKRTFIIKVLRLIVIILLLLTLLVLAIKIWHSINSDWVSILNFRGDIHLQNWMFLFYFMPNFLDIFIITRFLIFVKSLFSNNLFRIYNFNKNKKTTLQLFNDSPGAKGRNQTLNLLITIQLLYQLRYFGMVSP